MSARGIDGRGGPPPVSGFRFRARGWPCPSLGWGGRGGAAVGAGARQGQGQEHGRSRAWARAGWQAWAWATLLRQAGYRGSRGRVAEQHGRVSKPRGRQAAAGWRLGVDPWARAGDWPTEVRGQRRAATIRKNVRRHARDRLALLLWSGRRGRSMSVDWHWRETRGRRENLPWRHGVRGHRSAPPPKTVNPLVGPSVPFPGAKPAFTNRYDFPYLPGRDNQSEPGARPAKDRGLGDTCFICLPALFIFQAPSPRIIGSPEEWWG